MSDNDEPTIDTIRHSIDEKIGFLLDYNARATIVLRKQAKDFEKVAEFYQTLRDSALDVADDIATLTFLTSCVTGDIISAEFGSEEEEEEGEEGENEDRDPDEA